MITLEEINKIYFTKDVETHALNNITLTIENGEYVSIMGPSGCGKSTLLNVIGLLDNPTSGVLRIEGIDVAGMNDRQLATLRNQKLGFIFQNFHLIPSLTVQGNVELPMRYRKGKLPFDRKKRALEVLD
ncbi:MAG: ATP-binding cassette domain-containing protein, partial [Prevotellaceae bacterium]|nr:ATP-binding cassette domain-containing protein [Prevotellaceae bacterium]